ncbi:hypothetical protein ACFLU4_01045 [Chloroflexota bacterium]
MDREYCRKHSRYYFYKCPECAKEPIVDIDKLAKEASEKREQKQQHFENVQTWIDEATGVKYEGAFEICPDCGHRSLLYNNIRTKSKCHNPNCRTNVKTFTERLNDDWVF